MRRDLTEGVNVWRWSAYIMINYYFTSLVVKLATHDNDPIDVVQNKKQVKLLKER